MTKYVLLFAALVSVAACKSRRNLTRQVPITRPVVKPVVVVDPRQAFQIQSDSAELNFQTFDAKGKLEMDINGSHHSASINVRIKKDQIIWAYINVSFLPVARALITPDSIRILNLLQGKYIHTGFSMLKKYGGQSLDFKTLQALLTGNKPGGFLTSDDALKVLEAAGFELSGKKDSLDVKLTFNQQYKPTDLDLHNAVQEQHLHVTYSDFAMLGSRAVPQTIAINSSMKTNGLKLNLLYRKVDLNENIDFPFNAPAQ